MKNMLRLLKLKRRVNKNRINRINSFPPSALLPPPSLPVPAHPHHTGNFEIDGGVYDASTGRVAWGEWYKLTKLYSEVTMTIQQNGEEYKGSYQSSKGLAGVLVLRGVGTRG